MTSWREPLPVTVFESVRCKTCRRRLGNFDGKGRAEIVCPKCGTMNTIRPK
jgi:phage FluMu protein Com